MRGPLRCGIGWEDIAGERGRSGGEVSAWCEGAFDASVLEEDVLVFAP
jgi:hypothetical protein